MYNKFFLKSSLWIVFLVGTLFFGLVMGIMSYLMIDETMLRANVSLMEVSMIIGLVIGLLFGIMTTLFTQISRKSMIFWETAKNLAEKVKECNTKEELTNLYENDFKNLVKMAVGGPHNHELTRLFTIIKTKYDCR